VITADEIRQKSEDEGIHTSNVQRDYVFSWVLAGLYRNSSLANKLSLKGGNLYRKAYFPSTRFSNDLDFTTEERLDPNEIMRELEGICNYVKEQTGIEFDTDRNNIKDEYFIGETKSAYKVRLYFKDFFGAENELVLRINLDIAQLDKIYLTPIMTPLIHPYSDAELLKVDIRAIRLEEALADKLKCLIQRRHSFDLFDLVHAIFIDKTIEVNNAEMVKVFLKKTIFERSPGAAKNLLLGVPFDLMKDYWSKLVCPQSTLFEFDTAVTMFNGSVATLFDGLGGGSSELAFYPADLRNKIMTAGQNRKLLRMTYDGYTRDVEPYSLKYKITNDGTGREYFWGYDRTGGKSRTQSIKAFLNQKVQRIDILEEDFEPRYEIEVSKAGEIHDTLSYSKGGRRVASILGTPTSTRRVLKSVRRIPRGSLYGLDEKRYIIECSVCHKRFYRSSQFDTTINPHKSKNSSRHYGYQQDCYGSYGRYVGMKSR
jgi:predicted nucleotidyltransferase component of viral defense system